MSLIFVFVDGMGLGPENPDSNPLARLDARVLRLFEGRQGPFPGGGECRVTEVDMGVPGLPQSATGHTALWTGENAAQHIGRHLSGFPTPKLRELIRERSVFQRLKEQGARPTFANAYRPVFFQSRPRWVSASTVMCESAGVPLRTIDQLKQGRALYMDFTNRVLLEKGLVEQTRTPEEAASVLLSLGGDYDLTFYEYFLTDVTGHRGAMDDAVRLLKELDAFLAALVEGLGDRQSLLVTSDHGNIEDMTHARHTPNPVATLLWGEIRRFFGDARLEITDLAPAVVEYCLNQSDSA